MKLFKKKPLKKKVMSVLKTKKEFNYRSFEYETKQTYNL